MDQVFLISRLIYAAAASAELLTHAFTRLLMNAMDSEDERRNT